MPDQPIKISWDEVQSPTVDQRVKQQALLQRAQEHVLRQAPPPATNLPAPSSGSLWRNTVFYTCVFGLIGGLVGWAAGEATRSFYPNPHEEFETLLRQLASIELQFDNGRLTSQQRHEASAAAAQRYAHNPYVVAWRDTQLSEAQRNVRLEKLNRSASGAQKFVEVLTFMFMGCALGVPISIADQVVGKNWRQVLITGSIAAAISLVGSLVGSFLMEWVYASLTRTIGGSFGLQMLVRALAWAGMGSFFAVAPGLTLGSGKRFGIGLLGGIIGGTLGGLLFDPIGLWTQSGVASRFVQLLAIGGGTGAAIGLLENIAKTGWIKVVGGLITGKQFVIYKQPTYIGSSPQAEIYLFKDPQVAPRHAALHQLGGGYELEDLATATGTLVNGRRVSRVRLRPNDQIQIGLTTLVFQEKAKAS